MNFWTGKSKYKIMKLGSSSFSSKSNRFTPLVAFLIEHWSLLREWDFLDKIHRYTASHNNSKSIDFRYDEDMMNKLLCKEIKIYLPLSSLLLSAWIEATPPEIMPTYMINTTKNCISGCLTVASIQILHAGYKY